LKNPAGCGTIVDRPARVNAGIATDQLPLVHGKARAGYRNSERSPPSRAPCRSRPRTSPDRGGPRCNSCHRCQRPAIWSPSSHAMQW
jgi:hypothetical protein